MALHEADEADTIKREVEKRRTRLGASGPEQLKREVGREVWESSPVCEGQRNRHYQCHLTVFRAAS